MTTSEPTNSAANGTSHDDTSATSDASEDDAFAVIDTSDVARYRHVSVDAESLADALRGAAEFLDDAAATLGEPLIVVAVAEQYDATDARPHKIRLLVDEDELRQVFPDLND